MDNNQFIKAYQYAKQNPKSEYAIEFAKRVGTGQFNSQLNSLGVDTSRFTQPEKKNIFQRIGGALIKNEKAFGESIAGAVQTQANQSMLTPLGFNPLSALAKLTGVQKSQEAMNQAQSAKETTISQLVNRIQEKRVKGEDTSRLTKALSDLAGTADLNETTFNLLKDKSYKQVLGEGLGVATDIIGAGTIGTKTAGLVTKPTTALGGAIQGAKTGAATGAGFGAVQGVATGMQEDLDATGIATKGITGGIVGGAIGGVLGGVTGGVSGGLRGRNLRKQELNNLIESGDISDARLAKSGLQQTTDDAGNLTYKLSGKDKVAREAIKQGFDDADVALVKTASKSDKSKMAKMLETAEKASTNRRVIERPYDIVGESVLEPVRGLNKKLNSAVSQLDDVAKSLRGQTVNKADDLLTNIQDDLSGLGIQTKDPIKGTTLDDALDFTGSDLEGLGGNEKLIQQVWRRIRGAKDAYDLHRVKKYIDSNVDYGKSSEGLTGSAQNLLKGWRRSIDQALDSQFSKYNKVNTQISDIFGLLDEMNSVLGRKFKIGDEFANLRAGQVASRLLGNNATRGDIMRMLNSITKTADKYGIKNNQDIISQVVFADMLEDLFGTQATRGLQGQVQRAVRDGAIDTVQQLSNKNIVGATLELGKKGFEKARGINQASKIKALKSLLGL